MLLFFISFKINAIYLTKWLSVASVHGAARASQNAEMMFNFWSAHNKSLFIIIMYVYELLANHSIRYFILTRFIHKILKKKNFIKNNLQIAFKIHECVDEWEIHLNLQTAVWQA